RAGRTRFERGVMKKEHCGAVAIAHTAASSGKAWARRVIRRATRHGGRGRPPPLRRLCAGPTPCEPLAHRSVIGVGADQREFVEQRVTAGSASGAARWRTSLRVIVREAAISPLTSQAILGG